MEIVELYQVQMPLLKPSYFFGIYTAIESHSIAVIDNHDKINPK
jgi:hypothetical protein